MGRLFQLVATSFLHIFTKKTIFLITITSSKRVSELQALWNNPPFLKVFDTRVVFCISFQLFPKVTSKFYLNQGITMLAL